MDYFLYANEAQVVLPPSAELAADGSANATAGANATTSGYKGCALAPHVVLAGDTVAVLDNVTSPEACCRECQRYAGKQPCNVFHYCELEGGCR